MQMLNRNQCAHIMWLLVFVQSQGMIHVVKWMICYDRPRTNPLNNDTLQSPNLLSTLPHVVLVSPDGGK